MSPRSWMYSLGVVVALATLGCASAPDVSAATGGTPQTLAYASPVEFSSKSSACAFALQKVRRQAHSSCSVSQLNVSKDDCECERQGSKYSCQIEAAFTCR